MKNFFKIVFIFLSPIIFFSLTIVNVSADSRSYSIDHYKTNVKIQSNGDAQVSQKVTYHFNGLYHGVFLNLDYAGTKGVSEPEVFIVNQHQTTKIDSANVTISDKKQQKQIKVYHTAQDQTVTYLYRYTIHGAVKKYNDTDELNWKIIGNGWETDLNDVQIKISLPTQPVKKLQAWTHGPSNGHTTVNRQKGTVMMKIASLDAHQFVESHMIFPTTVTSTNTYVINKKRLKAVQNQERKFAKSTNNRRLRKQLISVGSFLIIFIISLWFVISQLVWFHRHKRDKVIKTPHVHNFEIPSEDAVTSQSLLNHNRPNTHAFTAYLLELAANKLITIVPEGKTFRLTQTTKYTKPKIGGKLLTDLFETVGTLIDSKDGLYSVTLTELKKFAPVGSGKNDLQDHFKSWQYQIYNHAESLGYFDKQNGKIKNKAILLLIFGPLLSIFTFVASLFLITINAGFIVLGWLLSILLLGFSVIIGISKLINLSPYTQTGEDEIGKIRNFKYMLKDIGEFDRSQVGDLILWEEILPYAVSFNLAKRVIQAMNTNFTVDELSSGGYGYYPIFFDSETADMNFASDFANSFNSGAGIDMNGNDASSSGSSGGFSGGDSGGFGGSSGGGAF